MAVDCQNDVANAAAERRAPQHGLFAQRAREQDAVKVRAVARLDALGEHGDDEPVALPALVVKRAQLPDDAKALSLLHRADAQQCLARTPQHSFVGVSYEKERGDMPCRARGQEERAVFRRLFFLSFA